MNKIIKISMVVLLVSCLLLSFSLPVSAQDNDHIKIVIGFTINEGENGQKIPRGSTIRHLDNGETKVYNSQNLLILNTSDSDADLVATPEGPMKANHVYSVPSGTFVNHIGNIITFYKDDQLILTVIDKEPLKNEDIGTLQTLTIPKTGGWVECAIDTGWKPNDFIAYWHCPSSPPGNLPNIINFLFTGIMPNTGSSIIQPVLQWNQGGAPGWTGSSWYVWNGGSTHTIFTPVSVGDIIYGEMYCNGINNYWNIQFYDINTAISLNLYVNTNISVNPLIGNQVFTALESYNNLNGDIYNSDMPGDTTFSDISITRYGQPLNVQWNKRIYSNSHFKMTGLDVTWSGNTTVTLHTAN